MTQPPLDGAPSQPGYAAPPPDSGLVWGILTTILCCLPLGIVSIVKASQVNTLWAMGQFDLAQQSAEQAKKWALWSAIAAIVPWLLVVLLVVVGGGLSVLYRTN
ncbi:CD225/dispanin family protein [Pseudonocardiaceae bacterium YIM PH 21723]|nr:CD225/dispanin family protein [Pseudonocardiaceae bacterium YIM PH 21723]